MPDLPPPAKSDKELLEVITDLVAMRNFEDREVLLECIARELVSCHYGPTSDVV